MRCRLALSSFAIMFGRFKHARLALDHCAFVDQVCACFLAAPNRNKDEDLEVSAKACSLLGRMWDQQLRAGTPHLWKRVCNEFQMQPAMARVGMGARVLQPLPGDGGRRLGYRGLVGRAGVP